MILGAHQDSTNQWPFLPAPYVFPSQSQKLTADATGEPTTTALARHPLSKLFARSYTPITRLPRLSSSTISLLKKVDCWGARRLQRRTRMKGERSRRCCRWI